jgi:hypothetical protein
MVSTLQVVEKQDVVGTFSDVVPVAQNTSQFVIGVPVLQGADVMLGWGLEVELELSLASASLASSASSLETVDISLRSPLNESRLAVPSRMPDRVFPIASRIDPALLTS